MVMIGWESYIRAYEEYLQECEQRFKQRCKQCQAGDCRGQNATSWKICWDSHVGLGVCHQEFLKIFGDIMSSASLAT